MEEYREMLSNMTVPSDSLQNWFDDEDDDLIVSEA